MKYIGIAKENVCRSNVGELYHIVRIHQIEEEACSLKDVFEGRCDALSTEFTAYKCPAGSKYYLKNNRIYCDVHGDVLSEEGAGGSDDELLPGTDLPLWGGGWPKEDMFDEAGMYRFKAGEIFLYDGKYYVITKDFEIYKGNTQKGPDAVIGWDFMEDISNKVWDSSTALNGGKLELVRAGDLFKGEDGSFYVFTPNQSGWADMPPEKYPNQWFAIPKN